MFCSSNRKKYTYPLLGPPGPTDNACLLVVVLIFGLEMLGLVQFDNKNCYNMVPNCSWCQIVCGAKLSMVPNCPRCQIVRGAKLSILHYGAKLSVVPNCPRCQIVRGAKLSGAKLSVVPNCPRCQIVLVPNCPIIMVSTNSQNIGKPL